MRRLATASFVLALLAAAPSAEAQFTFENVWNPSTGTATTIASAQFRSVVVNQTTGRLYIAASPTNGATNVGVVYYNLPTWNSGTRPTTWDGIFATTQPDGSTAWTGSAPYGITLDGDGNVYISDFGTKLIHMYDADGVFLRTLSTDGGTTNLLPTNQYRHLHAIGRYSDGTLRLFVVASGGTGVNRIVQSAPNSNQFTQSIIVSETNDGSTNYAAYPTATGDTVYVSSNGNGVAGGHGLRRYVNNGGTWGVDTAFPAAPITQIIQDIAVTSSGSHIVAGNINARLVRVYDANTGTQVSSVSFDGATTTTSAGGVALYQNAKIPVVATKATTTIFELLSVSPALPVELVSFTGAVNGTTARLAWQTASETNNVGFVVERLNGDTWADASGLIAGHGTTTEARAYAFDVHGLAAGTHTFRLRQLDTDGTLHYSPLTTVEIGLAAPYAVTLLGDRAVRVSVQEAQAVRVTVYDVLGRSVAMVREGELSGTEDVVLPTGLASGSYLVRVEGARFAATKTLVVR